MTCGVKVERRGDKMEAQQQTLSREVMVDGWLYTVFTAGLERPSLTDPSPQTRNQ